MELTEVARLAARSTDRFRLECLPTYDVPQEAADFARWQAGERELLTPETNGWLAQVRDTTAAGARWSRVRILDLPLSEYSRFHLHGLQGNAAAGERVFVAARRWSDELTRLRSDFWVFDEAVVAMHYDARGRFERPELVAAKDVERFTAARQIAQAHAVPLAPFLSLHSPGLVA